MKYCGDARASNLDVHPTHRSCMYFISNLIDRFYGPYFPIKIILMMMDIVETFNVILTFNKHSRSSNFIQTQQCFYSIIILQYNRLPRMQKYLKSDTMIYYVVYVIITATILFILNLINSILYSIKYTYVYLCVCVYVCKIDMCIYLN